MTGATTTPASIGDSHHDVIIVGGGIVGCFAAYYLLLRGRRVTVVERDVFGAGPSSGNCGYVCPSHVIPLCTPGAILHSLPQVLSRRGALSIPFRFDPVLWKWLTRFAFNCTTEKSRQAARARNDLLQYSMRLYREFLTATQLPCKWQDRGLLMVHRSMKSFEGYQSLADQLREQFDISVNRFNSDQLAQFEPSLVEGLAGGWHFPADAHLHPGEMMAGLRNQILAMGGMVFDQTDVLDLDVSGGSVRSLRTTAGKLVGDHYVFATGAEAPRFAKPLGCVIPIVPGKGYSMTFKAGEGSPTAPMIFEDTHVAITPLQDHIRVGSTMQLAGYDRTIDPRRVSMIRSSAQTYLKQPLAAEPISVWTGWRPMVHDDLPCIDRAPGASNAYVAAGNGMIGLSTGTATGKLIAEFVCEETPSLDPSPYSLRRFSRTNVKSVSAFSKPAPNVQLQPR